MTWHIASLVVRCRTEASAAVIESLNALPHSEVRGAEGARIVVITEAANEFELAQRFDAMRAIPGVMTTDLVHHEIDDNESEVAHAQHAP